jgi:hypothetical protein
MELIRQAMKTDGEVRYALRLPPDLHAALVDLAQREDRSLNQQIIRLLREGVRRDERRKRYERQKADQRREGQL